MASAKVLIADDSPLVLRMIEKTLESAGLHVVTARDGLEAIEKAFSDDFGLVILDVMMPRMNGYQACRLLKSEPTTRPIPVVILTSKDQPADRFWGIETGADYYLTKDANTERILELVKNILAADPERPAPPKEASRTGLDVLSRVNELLDRNNRAWSHGNADRRHRRLGEGRKMSCGPGLPEVFQGARSDRRTHLDRQCLPQLQLPDCLPRNRRSTTKRSATSNTGAHTPAMS